MVKLVFAMNQSFDGYVDHEAMAPSPVLFRHWIEHVRGLAGSVYGRRMYETMLYWGVPGTRSSGDTIPNSLRTACRWAGIVAPSWLVKRRRSHANSGPMPQTISFCRRCLLVAAALFNLLATPALACSVNDAYRVPTNLELAADADVILMARVESGTTEITGPDMLMTVTPIEVLKGRIPLDKPLTLPGAIAEPRFAVLSNPLQLEQAHPLAYIGGCTRYMFVRGATVLFFLTPVEKAFEGKEVPAQMRGMLIPAGGAFSRWAEDVPSAESPWVRATRIYVKAAALPAEQQKAMLIAERNKLRAAGDQESKIIADDIDRQLAGPNKPWNQLMEEEIKKMKERGENPLDGLRKH